MVPPKMPCKKGNIFWDVVAAEPVHGRRTHGKQEQTKFYDLRRRITEDFQRLAKFQRTLSKSTKKTLILSDLRF